VRAIEVEKLLLGSTLDEQSLDEAAQVARTIVSADMSDIHATVEYRRILTAELTRRVLRAAWTRSRM
jgi:CO/xanthine dehydrogenase FAD-binding subunit